jgi:hypothetical protein
MKGDVIVDTSDSQLEFPTLEAEEEHHYPK